MYTFKANSSKSNAKRFLVQTAKVDDFGQYLTQNGDEWGCYLDADGKPVRHQLVYAAQRAAEGRAPAGMANEAPAAAPAEAPAVGVLSNMAASATVRDGALEAAIEAGEAEADAPEGEDTTAGSAFGAFALGQLTAKPRSEPEAAPAANSSGVKIEKNRPHANGITRPSAGTICADVWELAEAMTASMGRTVPLAALVDAAKEQGINQFTARTQYACWRKFNGITGRVSK